VTTRFNDHRKHAYLLLPESILFILFVAEFLTYINSASSEVPIHQPFFF